MSMKREVYSVREMTELGYPILTLRADLAVAGTQFAFRTSAGGKWMINQAKYDAYLQKRSEAWQKEIASR